MQDKQSEALENQRRRRKRVARIRSAIILTITGWIIISLILIIVLFVKLIALENKLDNLLVTSSTAVSQEVTSGQGGAEVSGEEMTETPETGVLPDGTGIATVNVDVDDDNIASSSDIHKVYLTFDSEPSDNTSQILKVLDTYGVKATFFVSGPVLTEDSDEEAIGKIYKRIVDDGQTLGMHSYSNRYSVIYQSLDAFTEDYKKLYDYLFDVTGTECRYYRFLGGSSNQISNVSMGTLIDYLDSQDTVYFDWNVSAGDEATGAYTADDIVQNVLEGVNKYKTSVVLLHDSAEQSTTVTALGALIEALQDMDAEILPIDEDTKVIQYVTLDSESGQ
jgi:peptidoglycan/xylan/chitin deacetylase (PgdA/CDA1 family)